MPSRGWVVGAVLLVGSMVGCNDDPVHTPARGAPSPPPEPEPPSHEALQPLEAELLETLRANAGRTCPRPVLRGEATPGSADEAIRAVMEPQGPLVTCFDAAEDPPDDLAERCADLPAAVQAAVRHEDACGPYLHGRRACPASLAPYMRAATGLAAVARAWAEQGRAMEAMQLLLDGVRLGQDLARGGTSWLEALVAVAGASTLLREANALLSSSPSLAAEPIATLRAEVAALLASEPHPRGHLLSDHVEIQLYSLLPPFKRRAWEPPGGWPADTERPPMAKPEELKGAVLSWIALDDLASKKDAACPPKSDLRACVQGIEQMARTLTRDSERMPEPRESRNQRIRDMLQGIAATGWEEYVRRVGRRTFWLKALDVQLSVLDEGSCPEVDALGLESSGLGSPLRATAESGALLLHPPDWLVEEEPTEGEPLEPWRIACPSPTPAEPEP